MEDSNGNVPNIKFHYIKSKDFRVIHGDGAWGGMTPRGYITIGFYSERNPIPQELTHEVNADGQLGPIVQRKTKEGIVREMEVEVIVDLDAAKSLIQWLQNHVNILSEHVSPKGEQ